MSKPKSFPRHYIAAYCMAGIQALILAHSALNGQVLGVTIATILLLALLAAGVQMQNLSKRQRHTGSATPAVEIELSKGTEP